MKLLIIIINMLLAAFKLYQFFIDYKKENFFLASVELSLAIIFITCYVCLTWNYTLQAIT